MYIFVTLLSYLIIRTYDMYYSSTVRRNVWTHYFTHDWLFKLYAVLLRAFDTLMKYVIYNVKCVLLKMNKLFTNHEKFDCQIITKF